MCGIVGMVSKSTFGFAGKDDEIFEEMLYADAVRGMDSTGAFLVTKKNQVQIVKQAVNAGVFLMTQSWKDFKPEINRKAMMVVGHNRAATSGDVNSENAHPFIKNDIVLVHNGFIANSKAIDSSVKVDSESIITALHENKDDYLKGLANLTGAWAIVWYHHKLRKLFLARNNDRPLFLGEANDRIFFASEPDMMRWVLNRNGQGLLRSPTAITPYTVCEIDLNPFKMVEKSIPLKPSQPMRRTSMPPIRDVLEGDPSVARSADVFEIPEGGIVARPVQRAENDESDQGELQKFLGSYPLNSKVLFEPVGFSQVEKFTQVQGYVWLPGKPRYDAIWNVPSNDTKEEYLKEDGVPFEAMVNLLTRKNDRVVVIVANVKKPSFEFKDWNNQRAGSLEWADIVHKLACKECTTAPKMSEAEFTILGRLKGMYNIICAACVAKKYEKSFNDKKSRKVTHETHEDKPSING